MDQALFNWILGISSALLGWWLKAVWEAVRDLQNADKDIVDRVAAIDLLVAGQYAKRDYLDARLSELGTAIFNKLDRIETKLDRKADKP